MKDKNAERPKKVNSMTLEEVERRMQSLAKNKTSAYYAELMKHRDMLMRSKNP